MDIFPGLEFLNNQDEEILPASLEKVELVGFLFGAYWCENCRTFSETLTELYNYINSEHLKFEVIYINNDQNIETHDRFRQLMPWLSVKFTDQTFCHELRQKFEITTMPQLIILKPDGDVITRNGRQDIHSDYDTAFISWGGSP
jgi:nucleoredoxin